MMQSPSGSSDAAEETTENLSRSSSDADSSSTCDRLRGISVDALGTDNVEKGESGREEAERTSRRPRYARRVPGCADVSDVGRSEELTPGDRRVDWAGRCGLINGGDVGGVDTTSATSSVSVGEGDWSNITCVGVMVGYGRRALDFKECV